MRGARIFAKFRIGIRYWLSRRGLDDPGAA